MLYLGIDQHHKQIMISLRNEEATVIQRRQVSTRPEKTRAFLNELRRQSGEEGFMAILEVCGFNDWLIVLLEEYGCREIVLNQVAGTPRVTRGSEGLDSRDS